MGRGHHRELCPANSWCRLLLWTGDGARLSRTHECRFRATASHSLVHQTLVASRLCFRLIRDRCHSTWSSGRGGQSRMTQGSQAGAGGGLSAIPNSTSSLCIRALAPRWEKRLGCVCGGTNCISSQCTHRFQDPTKVT